MCFLFKIIFVLTASVGFATSVCNKSSCKPYSHFYTELGCKPVLDANKCCPTHFECPRFEKGKCTYKGTTYTNGQDIPDLSHICLAGCRCQASYIPEVDAGLQFFQCANIECPHYFNRPGPEIVLQYKFEDCCPYNYAQKSDNLHKCDFEGRTYYEGERMQPKSGCFNCICAKDFDPSLAPSNNPNCRILECGYQARNLGEIVQGCVPISRDGANDCCSIDWKCPDKDVDKVVAGPRHADVTSGDSTKVCKFGTLKLAVGDSLERKDKIVCTCKYPPLIECKKVN